MTRDPRTASAAAMSNMSTTLSRQIACEGHLRRMAPLPIPRARALVGSASIGSRSPSDNMDHLASGFGCVRLGPKIQRTTMLIFDRDAALTPDRRTPRRSRHALAARASARRGDRFFTVLVQIGVDDYDRHLRAGDPRVDHPSTWKDVLLCSAAKRLTYRRKPVGLYPPPHPATALLPTSSPASGTACLKPSGPSLTTSTGESKPCSSSSPT